MFMIKLIKLILFFSSTLLNLTIHSQTHQYEWAKRLGGSGGDMAFSIVSDDSGYVYTAGAFDGTGDFDPSSSSTFNLTAFGDLDVYISKLDSNGNFKWATQFGGQNLDLLGAIAVDDSGNVYSIGSFNDTSDFDPGPSKFNLIAEWSDIYITKLDATGNLKWAKKIGGASMDHGDDIAVDSMGNVYISGYFYGSVDFDPDTAVQTLTSTGSNDIFIAKLNPLGELIWVKQFKGNQNDYVFDIEIDDSNYVYTTGKFEGTVDFDPSNNSYKLTSSGLFDAFITKMDSNGNLVWAKKFGGSGDEQGSSIAVDEYGSVYINGDFNATVDFNPGSGILNLSPSGGTDIFISKLSYNGSFIWAKKMGGSTDDYGFAIAVYDSALYTTGHYNGTVDFNPNAGVNNLYGDYNVFVSKINYSGKFHWAKQIGSGSYDYGYSIDLGKTGNIHLAGIFQSTVDFDPWSGLKRLTSVAGYDAFVLKLNSCYTKSTISILACNSYPAPSGNEIYTKSGIYRDTIPNSEGCDSVITINLSLGEPSSSLDSVQACNTYTWQGQNITASGIYHDTISNLYGCDSLMTLDLTIKNSTSSSNTVSTCDFYYWNSQNLLVSGTYRDTIQNVLGCDSFMTLHLTILNSTYSSDTVSACKSYNWNGQNLKVSGTYHDTIQNVFGCDSTMKLNLSIIHIDTSVTDKSPTLISNSLNSQYQWINCNNDMREMKGDTNKSFTPTINGYYAVVVTKNNCRDTSACYNISNVGIVENTFKNLPSVFPNPSSGQFAIKFDKAVTDLNLKILNIESKVIYQRSALQGNDFNIDISNQANGIYFLELVEDKHVLRIKLLKY